MQPSQDTGRPATAGRFPRDFWIGVALLAFCAAAYFVTLSFKQAPAALAQNVQPATFPRLVIGVIVVLTALLMALGLTARDQQRRRPKLVMMVTAAMMAGFVFAFDLFGLVTAMALFCLVMPMIWGARPSARLVAFAIAFPAAVYVVFGKLLGVYFPPGLLTASLGI